MPDKKIEPALHCWAEMLLGGPVEMTALAGDGSCRRYYRVTKPDRPSLIALYGPDQAENLAFLRLGRHLWFQGQRVPRIKETNLEQGFFLLEDLGDCHLSVASPEGGDWHFEAVLLLADLHDRGLDNFNQAWCFQTKTYNPALVFEREIKYFIVQVWLDYLKQPRPPKGWAAEGRAFASLAAGDYRPVLMHRDFQSRNLMIHAGQVYMLDWQGARLGPAAYDLASLVYDPYVELPGGFQEELVALYLKSRKIKASASFGRQLNLLAAARLMQALGAYAKLSKTGQEVFKSFLAPASHRLAAITRAAEFKKFPILKNMAALAAQELA